VEANNQKDTRADQLKLTRQVGELADEVKLLAINLAITLAKLQAREHTLKELEPRFSDLIKGANEASHQVSCLLQGITNEKRMASARPLETGDEDRMTAFDKLETSLDYVYQLSQSVIRTIAATKKRQRVG
jgi:hypothetical protein